MLKSNIFAGEFWSKHTIGFLPGEGLFQGARAPQGHAVFAGWLVMFNAVSRAVEVQKLSGTLQNLDINWARLIRTILD